MDLELELDDGQSDLMLNDSTPYYKKGSEDYEKLINKPRINNIELIGNRELQDFGIQEELPEITNLELFAIWQKG